MKPKPCSALFSTLFLCSPLPFFPAAIQAGTRPGTFGLWSHFGQELCAPPAGRSQLESDICSFPPEHKPTAPRDPQNLGMLWSGDSFIGKEPSTSSGFPFSPLKLWDLLSCGHWFALLLHIFPDILPFYISVLSR